MSSLTIPQRLGAYTSLIRFQKPIGTLLLSWPMLIALWGANKGFPSVKVLCIFLIGSLLMRSAGCAINDFADRKIDNQVSRTKQRPLASGQIHPAEAAVVAMGLALLAFVLVLFTNMLTIKLSFLAVVLAFIYPFTKRVTHFPQFFMGCAFATAVLMAYAASLEQLPFESFILYVATLFWALAYDTEYAMADKPEDLEIGVKSTAVFFGNYDALFVAFNQVMTLGFFAYWAYLQSMRIIMVLGIVVASGIVIYQQFLIKDKQPEKCFQAFLNNNWFGATLFISTFLHYL